MSAGSIDFYTSGGSGLAVGQDCSPHVFRQRLIKCGDSVLGFIQNDRSNSWALRFESNDIGTLLGDAALAARLAGPTHDAPTFAVRTFDPGQLGNIVRTVIQNFETPRQ